MDRGKHLSLADYENLRVILKSQLRRPVCLEEAIATGDHLLAMYEILLDDRGDSVTISTDTT